MNGLWGGPNLVNMNECVLFWGEDLNFLDAQICL